MSSPNHFTEVRTRFAPSPTGYLHVGGARTALFNFLYAKAKGGKFILRIEDTDQERSTKKSEEMMLQSLQWLGLTYDEGPLNVEDKIGQGAYGPYRQSDRLEIYQKYVGQLIDEGKAYRCFCSADELELKKKQKEEQGLPPLYDGTCRHLSVAEVEQRLQQKQEFTIRFKTGQEEIIVNDLVQKEVRFDTSLFGDFIIVKSDGFPMYNFAVVVDDYLMKISHVIRGVGHLSNTPRQIVLYKAFGWPVPAWAHVSEIVGSDHKKLSKRHGATSITAFAQLGYSPEAFVNFISLLGWSHPEGKEFLSFGELCQSFDVARCSKNPAMFDVFDLAKVGDADLNAMSALELEPYLYLKSKLNHLSNLKIRATDDEVYLEEIFPFVKDSNILPKELCSLENSQLRATLLVLRVYLSYYLQIKDHLGDFFLPFTAESLDDSARDWLNKPHAKDLVELFQQKIASLPAWPIQPTLEANKEIEQKITSFIKECGEALSLKGKDLFMVLRAAVTGKGHGLDLPVFAILLGKENVMRNIQVSLSLL